MRRAIHPLPCFAAFLLASGAAMAQAPVAVQTNATIRVMAANITSGNFQRYETPGLNIFKGLKPDVVAVQEFNYAGNAFREMIDDAFGTNFVYFRESAAGYTIPNGIISRWPILESGSWDDVQVPDRGFAWALIDLPGPNDLFVVSVHLHSSGGASSRAIEATNLKALIQSNFPANAFLVLAGDFNADVRTESCVTTMKTFLSDSPIPHDGTAGANPNSNASRLKPFDYVLPSFTFATNLVATVIGPRSFANGLVFDSRVYTNLADVGPVQAGDSAAVNMQHMAVLKDFRVSYSVTNFSTVPRPLLTMTATHLIQWHGVSNLTYTVQASSSLTNWDAIGTAFSATTNFTFNIASSQTNRQFFRVIYP
jgi:endonuclease/exonuclease/phosphatase family metal-dependent hydrolase